MEKREFEQRYGKEVSKYTYSQIEKTYMACSGYIDKDKFCAGYKQIGNKEDALEILNDLTAQAEGWKNKARIEKEAKQKATEMFEACNDLNKDLRKEVASLDEKLKNHIAENSAALVAMVVKGGLYKEAEEIFGRKRVIAVKLTAGIELDIEDQRYIIEQFR